MYAQTLNSPSTLFLSQPAVPEMYRSFVIECPIPLDMAKDPEVVFISSEVCGLNHALKVGRPGLIFGAKIFATNI
jgi:hypothetical protein